MTSVPNYEIYFWCPAPSPHVLPLAYAAHDNTRFRRVVYVAQHEIEPERQRRGWEVNVRKDAHFILDPSPGTVERIIRESAIDAIHIFYGMRRVPCIVAGIKAAIKYRRRFGIYTEPRVLEGASGAMRLAQSLLTEGRLRKHADFVLAIGAHGRRWFRWAGYAESRLFPAAYFLDLRGAYAKFSPSAHAEEVPNVAFLGRMEPLKGFDRFLQSIPQIRNPVRILTAGSGSLAGRAEELARSTANFSYAGVIPMSTVPEFLSEIDILVLPSITMDDGWGAVVSEALMAGAAIVTSDKVGASMCLVGGKRGLVVPPHSAPAIAQAIDALIDQRLLGSEHRLERSRWAAEHLDQAAGAAYLLRVFDHLYAGRERPAGFL